MTESHADRPILVLGHPRSGTSLVAGCLAACGAWTGKTFAGDDDNPGGYFENVRLREAVDKTVLAALGCDPLGVSTLPPLDAVPRRPEMRSLVLDSIRAEGYAGDRRWLFKDAKLTLLWPLWHAMFPAARWVIVERPEEDIVRSCLATGFMAQHSSDPAFWHRMVAGYRQRLDALREVADCLSVATPGIVAAERDGIRATVDATGLAWNEDRVAAFVSPAAWGRARGRHGADRTSS